MVDSFKKEELDKFEGVAIDSVVEGVAVGVVSAKTVDSPTLQSIEDPDDDRLLVTRIG